MIRNEAKLIGRLTADPELKYTKNSNTPVCNVVLAVNNIYNDDAEYLHLVFWDKKATNLCKYKGKGDLIAVTGYLKTRSYIDSTILFETLSKSSLMKLIILASPKRVLIRVKIFLTLTQTTSHRKNIR